jgi:hypothetical protein
LEQAREHAKLAPPASPAAKAPLTPVVLLCQRKIVSGLTAGAVKG